MLRKFFILMAFSALTVQQVSAQEVFTEIRRLSFAAARDTTKSVEERKIATFKVDALDYFAQKSRELTPDSSMSVLDYQAYAMYEYVNLFAKRYTEVKKRKKEQVIYFFKQASLNNPRFGDEDTGLTHAYIDKPGYLTQFSLDTDWVKALDELRHLDWSWIK